jgi:hypothetical protein
MDEKMGNVEVRIRRERIERNGDKKYERKL